MTVRRTSLALLASTALAGCFPSPAPMRVEDWIRVGADPEQEAEAEVAMLERAGYEATTRIDGDGFVALAFVRERDAHRAVRVVTRLGVGVALDSHETDGVRVRHGLVRLVELAVRDHDLDRDGDPEIVVARTEGGRECVAVVRIDDEGHVSAAPIEADAIAPGSCASELADVDADGALEAIVELRWPDLALAEDRVPSVRIALGADEGGWRASAVPVTYEESQRDARNAALIEARQRLDLARASQLGVELAGLANVRGATVAAQVALYDDALRGLVLQPAERDRVEAVRAYIAAGWAAPER